MTHAQIAQLTTLDRLDAQAAYFEDGEQLSVRVPRSAYERMGSPTTLRVLLTPTGPATTTEVAQVLQYADPESDARITEGEWLRLPESERSNWVDMSRREHREAGL